MRLCNPDILIDWQAVPPPKFKKDYEGKLVRVHSFTRYHWQQGVGLPHDGSVCSIARRYSSGGTGGFDLELVWNCPVCDVPHRRTIPESWIIEGKAEFVEAVGLADFAHNLEEEPAPLLFVVAPVSYVMGEQITQVCFAKDCTRWLFEAGYLALNGTETLAPALFDSATHVLGANAALRALEVADALCVLILPGVEDDAFVRACVNRARRMGIPCNQVDRVENALEYKNSFRIVHDPRWWR